MNIQEVGIIIGGIPIIYRNYEENVNNNIDDSKDVICKSALLSSLLDFAETLISPMEYFESNKYSILFRKNKIRSNRATELDIFAYLISDKEKKKDIKSRKIITRALEDIIKEFKFKYDGDDYSEVSHFKEFKKIIDRILDKANSAEEKFASLF